MIRVLALLLALAAAPAQSPAPGAAITRFDSNLVQVDAAVTDSHGHPVAGLKAADFEILQDGKPQAIATFAEASREHRTIVMMVDDFGLSAAGLARIRQTLTSFAGHDMQKDDWVSILRTGSGTGAAQQFTSDPRLLAAHIDRLHYDAVNSATSAGPVNEEVFSAGTLGALRYAVDGLRQVPGRKCVVLFSEREGPGAAVADAVRRLADAAGRAAAVIYAVDPSGKPDAGRGGLAMLAQDTGGLFLSGPAGPDEALRKVLEYSRSHYLIGYHPSAAAFDPAVFHTLEVRARPAGLEVRARSGFLGVADSGEKPAPHASDAGLARALASPFDSGCIHVRLTPLFAGEPQREALFYAYLYLDAADLKFTKAPEGWRQAVFDVLVSTYGGEGRPAGTTSQTYTVRIGDEEYRGVLEKGLVWLVSLPVRDPGAFQMRVALRDAGSECLGSASHYIDVPDVSGGRMAMSSLNLGILAVDSAPPTPGLNEDQVPTDSPKGSAAVRRFKPGANLFYAFQLLNAHADSRGLRAVSVISYLYHEGQQVFAGKPATLGHTSQANTRITLVQGTVRLGDRIGPGDYELQVIVTDPTAGSTVSRWTDFEVARE